MKKIYALFSILVIGLSSYANPIALPMIDISELFFDESGNWKLELGYYEINESQFPVDSIFLYSTTDTVKLSSYEFYGTSGVMVITADSLDSDFVIKRYADTIKVVSYVKGDSFEDVLIFGSSIGAPIDYPRPGQSLSKYRWCFAKDNSPSIGLVNDTIGMCGTVKGVVYDKFSDPVQNRTIRLDFDFTTTENGEYVARVLSKPSTFDYITYRKGKYTNQSVSMTEHSYIMEPDSTIEFDMHLLDTLGTGVSDIGLSKSPITIFPNPISINEKININIDLPILTSDIWVEIVDLNGKLIRKEKINRKESTVDAPSTGGVYIVSAWLDSQMISSQRIIVND